MTAPPVTQTKAKAWWATIIPAIGSLVPLLLQVTGVIPAPWGPALTGILMVFAAITGVTVHQVSNAPAGTVLVPVPKPGAASSGLQNPWKD